MNHILNAWYQDSINVNGILKPYFARKDVLSCKLGCLMWGSRVVVVSELRKYILNAVHCGQPGIVKVKNMGRSDVWWPGFDADVEKLVINYEGC